MSGRGKIAGRAERMSHRVGRDGALGRSISEFLRSEQNVERMLDAATKGLPPASAVSEGLVGKFGHEALSATATRQFIGWLIRAILEEREYVPASAGIRIPNDRLFQYGTTYKSVPNSLHKEADAMLERLVGSLTPAELTRAKFYIDNKLQLADGKSRKPRT